MAVGDIISSIFASGVVQNFQPAVGVEIIVTSGLGKQADVRFGLTDGVSDAWNVFAATTTTGARDSANIKIGITNTNYLYLLADSSSVAFTGIQIK
jgi:hypothetical protein